MPTLPNPNGTAIDAETVLPLSLIRVHTKTEDVETVSDEQLRLYRDAAIELAEQYTDVSLLRGDGLVEQFIGYRDDMDYLVRLDFPATDGIVTVQDGHATYVMVIPAGATTIRLGRGVTDIEGKPVCCMPCSQAMQSGIAIRYASRSGCSADKVMAGIRVGMLQFIAYAIHNPGDCADAAKACGASGAMWTFRRYQTQIGF